MTKKRYQKPVIDIIVLKCNSLLIVPSVGTNLDGLGGGTNGVSSTAGAWSRQSSDRDDNWDE